MRFVGPLLPHRTALASEPIARLEGAESVIVVSQGTVDNKDPEKLLAPALQALSGTGHVVVAATGRCNTEQLRERFPAENVVIEDFVDFATLFERARLFVCNGGHGSVMLALWNGVPVLAAGKREGKNDINARIVYVGVGIDLHTERPTADKIAKGVARILADPGYGERAARLRDELRSYEPIDLVVNDLLSTADRGRDELGCRQRRTHEDRPPA